MQPGDEKCAGELEIEERVALHNKAVEEQAKRTEGGRLVQEAFVLIRSICGHVGPSCFHSTESDLTSGERAWIWALAEFSHNIPRLMVHAFSDSFFSSQMDNLKKLLKLYAHHQSEIIGRRAEGWTRERIYSLIVS